MTVLSPEQIGALIYFVGGWGPNSGSTGANTVGPGGQVAGRPPKNDPKRIAYEKFLDVAIAVCLAESGGDTAAKNANSSATGLWQIMVSVHKERIEKIINYIYVEYDEPHGRKKPNIYDPRVNTFVAKEIYHTAGGWSPWEAYNTGAYKRHLGHGKKAYKFITNKDNLQKERDAIIANIMETQNYADLAATVATPLQNINPLNAVRNAVNAVIDAGRQAGIAIGVFLVGIVLLILGILVMVNRTGVARKVPGPTKLVTNAVRK